MCTAYENLPTNLTFQTLWGSSKLSGLKELILAHIWPNTDLVPSGPARPPLLRERFTCRLQRKKQKRECGLICFFSVVNNFLLDRPVVLMSMSSWVWQLFAPQARLVQEAGWEWRVEAVARMKTQCGVKSKALTRNSHRQAGAQITHITEKSPYERHHM